MKNKDHTDGRRGPEQHDIVGVLVEVVHVTPTSLVECFLVDIRGTKWTLIGKLPIATIEPLDADTMPYQLSAFIACRVVESRGHTSRIDTSVPGGARAVSGEADFDVFTASLVRRSALSSVV